MISFKARAVWSKPRAGWSEGESRIILKSLMAQLIPSRPVLLGLELLCHPPPAAGQVPSRFPSDLQGDCSGACGDELHECVGVPVSARASERIASAAPTVPLARGQR